MTNDADSRPLHPLVMRGWRHFRCGMCNAHFREPSRDHATPSGVECDCGEWVFPYESHADAFLSYHPATGNLIGVTEHRQRLA